MEGLQLTYMLEDLNGLRNVKEQANALLTATSTPTLPTTATPTISLVSTSEPSTAGPTQHSQQTLQPPSQGQRHHARTNSASGLMSRGASPAIFDNSNRRLFTPPLTRNNSHQGSVPGTPRHSAEQVEEPSLVLQELRKRLRKQELAELKKMRDAIAAMHSSIQQQQEPQTQQGDTIGREGAPDFKRKSFSYTGSPRSPVL